MAWRYKKFSDDPKAALPGGNILTMIRLLQIGLGCLAWFLPTIYCMENQIANPGYLSKYFRAFTWLGVVAWMLPMFKLSSWVKWPIGPGPESMISMVAGFFSATSGICISILQDEIERNVLYTALGLNVAHTTLLFGTPVAICANHAFRLFFFGNTDLVTLQALANIEAHVKADLKEEMIKRESKKKEEYEMSECNAGNAFQITKKDKSMDWHDEAKPYFKKAKASIPQIQLPEVDEDAEHGQNVTFADDENVP